MRIACDALDNLSHSAGESHRLKGAFSAEFPRSKRRDKVYGEYIRRENVANSPVPIQTSMRNIANNAESKSLSVGDDDAIDVKAVTNAKPPREYKPLRVIACMLAANGGVK